MQAFFTMWFALGAITAGVMAVGFKRSFRRLTLRHYLHIAVAVPLWPIPLASALLAAFGDHDGSVALEHFTHGWIDTLCDWWDLRQLRKRGGDGGSLAYLKDMRHAHGLTPTEGRYPKLEDCDDVLMDPEVFVRFGGQLPPDRPQGATLIRVQKGVAQWETEGEAS